MEKEESLKGNVGMGDVIRLAACRTPSEEAEMIVEQIEKIIGVVGEQAPTMFGRVFQVNVIWLAGDTGIEWRLDPVPIRFELALQALAVRAIVEIDLHRAGTLDSTRLASSRISSSIRSRLRS